MASYINGGKLLINSTNILGLLQPLVDITMINIPGDATRMASETHDAVFSKKRISVLRKNRDHNRS